MVHMVISAVMPQAAATGFRHFGPHTDDEVANIAMQDAKKQNNKN